MIESYNERVDKYNKMSVEEQRTTEGRDLVNRLGSQRKSIDMFWKLNSIGASGYKRLAGEVEARNVEKRAGMPMAERLATLVEETEDVAREDQILLRESVMQGQPKYSMQTINALSDALSDYNTNGDIVAFVDKVREANDKFGKHPYLTNVVMDYDEEGDAEWFAERVKRIVGRVDESYAPYTAGGVRFSISNST
jgi:hypothetical protein